MFFFVGAFVKSLPSLTRFAALQEPLEKKKKKVDEKENLREFNKLAGDEEQYLKEKQIALDNNNLGTCLSSSIKSVVDNIIVE